MEAPPCPTRSIPIGSIRGRGSAITDATANATLSMRGETPLNPLKRLFSSTFGAFGTPLASQHGSRSTLISDDHRLEGVRWKTEFNNRRRSPAREVRIVRMGAEPVQRRCLPSAGTSTSNPPQQVSERGGSAPAEAFAPTLISFDNLGIRSVEIHPRPRELHSRGVRSGPFD